MTNTPYKVQIVKRTNRKENQTKKSFKNESNFFPEKGFKKKKSMKKCEINKRRKQDENDE